MASPTTTSSSSSSSAAAASGATADATCRYAGKKCGNERATKRNGALHNLCHYHRVRANQNQRRMELRRRLTRTREDREVMAVVRGFRSSFCDDIDGIDSIDSIDCRSAPASLLLPPSAFQHTRAHVAAATSFSALLQDAAHAHALLPPSPQSEAESEAESSLAAAATAAAATWSYFAAVDFAPPPTHDALFPLQLPPLSLSPPALSPQDHLSELFSAAVPEHSQSSFSATADLLPHVSARFSKQLLGDEETDETQLRIQFAAALSSPVSPGHPSLLASSMASPMATAVGVGGRSSFDALAFPEHPQVIWCDQELLL